MYYTKKTEKERERAKIRLMLISTVDSYTEIISHSILYFE